MTTQPLGRRRWSNEPLVVFVEGYSDLLFYAEMMEHLGKHNLCFIQDLGGKGREKLEQEALLLLKPDNLASIRSVAVILDADDNRAKAFELAGAALRKVVGVEIPESGLWVQGPGGRTRFGVFVAGGPSGKGEVETLAWLAWQGRAENRALRDCVASYLECAQKAGRHLHSLDKARVGTLLAVVNDQDPRLGPAARANAFDFHAAELADLRKFLEQM